jgi:hypothetical protein
MIGQLEKDLDDAYAELEQRSPIGANQAEKSNSYQ